MSEDAWSGGFAAWGAASKRQPRAEALMPSRLDPPDMPRLDVLYEEFGEGAAAALHARRRRTGARLLMLAIVALGLGVIGALAFAWSNADGRLRFELQSAATAPKSAQRAAAPQEIERLRGNSTRRRTTSRSSRKHSIRRRIPSRR